MFRKLAATVAVSTALISPSAWSLGLGDIDADSGLNQPLKAEISLLSSRDVSEDDLRAKLASYESYEKFGVQREAYHNSLFFDVITKEDGTKAIVVESRESIKEPFINFLVELSWTQGKLLREYTLLLDPPIFSKARLTAQPKATTNTRRQPVVAETERSQPPQSRQTQDATSSPTPTPTPTPTEQASPEPVQPKVNQETRQLASSAEFNGDSWNVKRGQTLWSIAKAVRPDGVSVQQTLMAIFHNNPEAFINNDINRMKAGADLNVPERSAISDVSQSAAIERIRSSSNREEVPLDVRKTIEETDVEDTESQGGRLSIASADEGSTEEESGGSALDADMDSAASDSSSDDSLASNSGDTTSDFDSELSAADNTADDGFAVEDETLSVLSGAADKTDETLANEKATEIVDSYADDNYVDDNYVDDNTQEDDSGVGTASSETASSETDDKKSTADEAKKATPVNSMQQNSDKAFYEADDFWLWTGGGLVLLLLIGGGIVYRRNTAVEDDGGLLGMMGGSSEPKPKKKRESFISDKDLKAPKENIDPISQADILVARGRLKEAEDVLEDGLAAEPGNQEVRVKLMEVVASQQDVDKFNRLKAELPNDFDHDSSLGLKVASLSSLVEPSEPEIAVESPEFNLPSEDDVFGDESSKHVEVDLSDELAGSDTDSIDTVGNLDDNQNSEDSLDLDLGDFESQLAAEPAKSKGQSQAKERSQIDENSIEFDLNQDDEDLVTQEDDSSTNETDISSGGDDSRSDDSNSADVEGLNEEDAATKIDLAKAYMELGDDDAARDILQEIKDEGNRGQQEQADKLLSQM